MMTASAGSRFWRTHSQRYDRVTLMLNRRFADMTALASEDVSKRGKVLEVAAGTGLVTVAIARAATRVVATDRASEMLEVLRGRVADQGIENVEVKEADAVDLPFDDASFDGVVAANLLHLLPDPAKALAEARRVLRPSGVLVVPTFGHGHTSAARVISFVLRTAGLPVRSRFTQDSLVDLVESAGFRVTRSAVVPGLLPLVHVAAVVA